jgi:uncharacterized protein
MNRRRTYRNQIHHEHLKSFRVVVKETDLHVHANLNLDRIATELILRHRGYIESYIQKYPEFGTALVPWPLSGIVPTIVGDMIAAGEKAGVGPMAAVAGAIAEHVGRGLLAHTDEVIVENGGDIFMKTNNEAMVAVYAGRSPLSMRIGIQVDPRRHPVAVCTSSGTIGHSLSMGRADAACVVSDSCSLSDAAATAIGNVVRSEADIQPAVDFGRAIDGVRGILVVIGNQMGLWGDLNLVRLSEKKVEF